MRGTAAARREQTLPMAEEASQGVLLDGLDFAAELGERFAANLAEDFCVAPLPVETGGAEAAFEDAAFRGKRAKRIFNDSWVEGKAVCGFTQREGAMGAGVPADEFEHRMRHRLEKRGGKTGRQRNAEGIAIAGCILGCDKTAFACDAQFKQATGADQAVYGFEHRRINDSTR